MPKNTSGSILLLALVFLGVFMAAGTAYVGSITSYERGARKETFDAAALALADAGIDQAVSQLNQNGSYTGASNVSLGNGTYSVTVSSVNTNTKRISSTGYIPNATNPISTKTVTTLVGLNTSFVAFHYGVQVGAGGASLSNNAQINGNLRSDGSITGNGTITGDVIVAGANSITDVTVNGNVYAHTLSSCTVYGDAYYQMLSGCSVSGTRHASSTDPVTEAMPISDAQIDAWEATASTGTLINSSYTLTGTQSLGPAVINGDLTVNGTLTLSGVVWVKGNINFQNNAGLSVAASTGNEGAILIADVPGSEGTKGSVNLSNNITVSGNGSAGSYPMVLSTNSSGSAISLGNNADSVILYASRGTISVSNNASANQITAYRLSLQNNATITYLSGLQNAGFSGGPGGSWAIVPHTYAIAH